MGTESAELQKLHFTKSIAERLEKSVSESSFDRIFILTDQHSYEYCYPVIAASGIVSQAVSITVPAGDIHKNIETLSYIWLELSKKGATRKSLLLNLGGGMITDLGGFAASAFKRGIRYFNIPTTLLGAVDAAVGGKTGINFNGLKNEIGVFNPADEVLISTAFFRTLDRENFLSGYAEMLKHGLLSGSEAYDGLFGIGPEQADTPEMLQLVRKSVQVKESIVKADPYERGLRKALNLGHTVGHAFESLSHFRKSPVYHGYAVAWGLVCELLLSHLQLRFPLERVRQLAGFVRENYGVFPIGCKDYPQLLELMRHDKKNDSEAINFTLLKDIGQAEINQTASSEKIEIMFDLYRDLFNL